MDGSEEIMNSRIKYIPKSLIHCEGMALKTRIEAKKGVWINKRSFVVITNDSNKTLVYLIRLTFNLSPTAQTVPDVSAYNTREIVE